MERMSDERLQQLLSKVRQTNRIPHVEQREVMELLLEVRDRRLDEKIPNLLENSHRRPVDFDSHVG